MKSVIVLGAGMVGKTIAADLSNDFKVTSTDINKDVLTTVSKKYGIETKIVDVTNRIQLAETIGRYDLVISAVPGFMGYNVLKSVIETGKNIVDISFFPEDPLSLNKLAKQKNVTALVDAGVAPGIDNLILGYYNARMKVESFECVVGGLPKNPKPPYYYKAPFSPIDVIEEYTRPARFIKNGKLVVKQALTDVQEMCLPKAGKLVSVNTDGLRTLLTTMKHIPNMIEKTLRFSEHIKIIKTLLEGGYFDKNEININYYSISPLTFTSKLLINYWKLEPGEKEFTVMRVTIKGKENKKKKTIVYDLYDEYDVKTGFSSMSRTTGFTCTACANLVLKNLFQEKGIFPLELVGKDEAGFNFVFEYLKKRGVQYTKRVTEKT